MQRCTEHSLSNIIDDILFARPPTERLFREESSLLSHPLSGDNLGLV